MAMGEAKAHMGAGTGGSRSRFVRKSQGVWAADSPPQLEVNVIGFTHSLYQLSPWVQGDGEGLGNPSSDSGVPGSRDQQVSFLLG